VLGTGDTMMVIDKGGANVACRFYRLRVSTAVGLPAGFIQIEMGRGRRPVSSPFDRAAAVAGRITSLADSAFVDLSANWPADRWTGGGYIARVRTAQGWIDLPITASSANQISTLVRGKNLRDIVQTGDAYEIAPVQTVQEFFAATLADISAETSRDIAPRVQVAAGRNDARLEPLHYEGKSWRASDGRIPDNNFPIAPGDGLLVTRFPAARLWLSGDVHLPRHPADISVRGETFVGTHIPFDVSLRDLSLASPTSLNWRASQRVRAADLLRVWTRDRFLVHYFDGAHWRRAGGTAARDNEQIPAASAFLIDRRTQP
jgi:hypothetical protein